MNSAGLYSLGKESLLVKLAMEFKTWVEVDVERLETLRVLELPDVFTTERGAGRIRVVSQSEINASNLLAWNKEQPTIAILPTSRPMVSSHPNVHVVPYSDHSSYQELEDFVSALRPGSLVPIVGNCLPYFSSHLSPRKKRKAVIIPESVQHFMMNETDILASANSTSNMFPRTSRPRGVVFDSPGSQTSHLACDGRSDHTDADTNSVMDEESDCILVDMSPDSFHRENGHQRKRLKLVRVASEDVVTLGSSLPPDDNESVNSLKHARSPDSNCTYERERERERTPASKKSPQMGSTNSRETCFSMDSIRIHDRACVAAEAPLTTFTLEREHIERWLICNFTAPAEELKGEQVLRGLDEFRLTPVDCPKRVGDPLEEPIKML